MGGRDRLAPLRVDAPPLAEAEPAGGAAPGDDAPGVDAAAAADELFDGFAFRLVDMEQHVRPARALLFARALSFHSLTARSL